MANPGVYPFVISDPPTDLQLLRVLISDDSPTATADPILGDYLYVSDASALALLSLAGGSIRLAGAALYESLAATFAMTPDYRQDDLQVSPSKSADFFLKLAARWREEDALAGGEDEFLIGPTGFADWSHPIWPEGTPRPYLW